MDFLKPSQKFPQTTPSESLFFVRRYANVFLALGLLICVLLPDFVMNALMKSDRLFWDWVHVLCLVFLCYGLSFLQKKMFCCLWFFFAVLEAIQFSYIAYFGVPIFPNAVMAVAYESRDIFNPTYLKQIWFVYPVVGIFYGVGIFLFLRIAPYKRYSKLRSFLIVTYVLSIICTDGLTIRPIRLIEFVRGDSNWLLRRCFRQEPAPSLRGSLFTLSATGILNVFCDSLKDYKPYKTLVVPPMARNIVLIMGESFNANRLSLFGYHRKTTPHLDILQKEKDRFIGLPGYSAAPNTINSILYFFNAIREPDNFRPLATQENNLFRWAKTRGFKTFLITNNGGSLNMGLGSVEHVSSSIALEAYPHTFYPETLRHLGDRGLSHVLKNLPLSEEKNFIVIHLLSSHSPYDHCYKDENDTFSIYPQTGVSSEEALSNTYDNSVHYVDSVIHDIMEVCKKRFTGKDETYVVFTADHGELFGCKDPVLQSRLYGHCHLNLPCVAVPFFLYSLEPLSENVRQLLPQRPAIAAYEISKLILSLMGVQLTNPNQENPDLFYVTEGPLGGGRRSFPYTITSTGEAICENSG